MSANSKKYVNPENGAPAICVIRAPDGNFFAVSDDCPHGKGQLHVGDIEDVGACAGGGKPDSGGNNRGGLCIRCPRHDKKFAGGLFFRLEDGSSVVKGQTPHWTPDYKVNTFSVKVEGGRLLVNTEPVGGERAKRMPVFSKAKRNVSAILGGLCGSSSSEKGGGGAALQFMQWKLDKVESVNHDTAVYHLSLSPPPPPLSIGAMWHVSLRANCFDAGEISRDYTPVSSMQAYTQGALRLLIRKYPQGLMSRYVAESLRVGSTISVSHPVTTLELPSFLPPSSFFVPDSAWPPKGNDAVLGCIAGGTGITPVLQLLESVQATPSCRLNLLFSAKTDADLYLQKELAAASQNSQGRIKVWYTVTQSAIASQGGGRAHFRTRINEEMIAQSMPQPTEVQRAVSSGGVAKIVVCGPEAFMQEASRLLQLQGHSTDHIVLLDA